MVSRACEALIVLSRGIDEHGQVSANTQRRAKKALQTYRKDPTIKRIVCSGKYSASLPQPPKNNATEAGWIADFLIKHGLPHRKVEKEDLSVCTFTNFIKIVEGDFLADLEISPERQLGLVAGRPHGWRASPVARVVLDVPDTYLKRIISPGEMTPREILVEGGLSLLTAWVLRDVTPGNLEEAWRARTAFEKIAALLPGVSRDRLSELH